jgi:hypothetical protein
MFLKNLKMRDGVRLKELVISIRLEGRGMQHANGQIEEHGILLG